MTKLQWAARGYLIRLALDIREGAWLWPEVDRIERRFRMVGFTETTLAFFRSERANAVQLWIDSNVDWESQMMTRH